jgi:hypothetical protein
MAQNNRSQKHRGRIKDDVGNPWPPIESSKVTLGDKDNFTDTLKLYIGDIPNGIK